jgi:hypothetical protein
MIRDHQLSSSPRGPAWPPESRRPGRQVKNVKQVEHLHPELYRDSFGNGSVLDDGEINGLEAWSFELIAASVAEGSRRIIGERVGVDPLYSVGPQTRWIGRLNDAPKRVADEVREIQRITRMAAGGSTTQAGVNREGEPVVVRNQRAQFPPFGQPGKGMTKLGDVIEQIAAHVVPGIKIGIPIVRFDVAVVSGPIVPWRRQIVESMAPSVS